MLLCNTEKILIMDRVTILSLMVNIVNLRTEISDVKCVKDIAI